MYPSLPRGESDAEVARLSHLVKLLFMPELLDVLRALASERRLEVLAWLEKKGNLVSA